MVVVIISISGTPPPCGGTPPPARRSDSSPPAGPVASREPPSRTGSSRNLDSQNCVKSSIGTLSTNFSSLLSPFLRTPLPAHWNSVYPLRCTLLPFRAHSLPPLLELYVLALQSCLCPVAPLRSNPRKMAALSSRFFPIPVTLPGPLKFLSPLSCTSCSHNAI
jgi:hypothetical protein